MRELFILVVLCPIFSGCARAPLQVKTTSTYPHSNSALVPFVDQDLSKYYTLFERDSSNEDLNKAIKTVLSEEQLSTGFLRPHRIWRNEFDKEKRGFIIAMLPDSIAVPSATEIEFHFVNDSDKPVTTYRFSVGWRICPISAELLFDESLQCHVLVVHSSPEINGRYVARQIYGMVDNRMALLWLENTEGEMIRNIYKYPNHTIGPEIPQRLPEDWEKTITSGQSLALLEALTWLGGTHRPGLSDTPKDVSREKHESSKLVADIRNRPGVKQALIELRSSKNPWIQKAAKLAMDVKDEKDD